MTVSLNQPELDTILAALRYYQHNGQGDPTNRTDWVHAIATDHDEISLDAFGIDQLCAKLNESPLDSYADWKYAVDNEDTKLDYTEWLAHREKADKTAPAYSVNRDEI